VGEIEPLGYLWFSLRLAAIFMSFGVVGMLVVLNLDLWRARRMSLPGNASPVPWWAVPIISLKLVSMNTWACFDMVFSVDDLFQRPVWRPYVLLVLGALGLVAIRAVSRAVRAYLDHARTEQLVREGLQRQLTDDS
jgi:hypothetical protein